MHKSQNTESISLGAAYLAGLGSGVRGSTDELLLLRQAQRSYKPAMGEERRKECLDGWSKVVQQALAV